MSGVFDIDRNYPDLDPAIARSALRQAAKQLNDRGLAAAARWSLELLQSVRKPIGTVNSNNQSITGDDGLEPRLVSHLGGSSTPAIKRPKSNTVPAHSTPALGLQATSSTHDNLLADNSGRFASTRYPPSPLSNLSHVHDPDSSAVSIQSDAVGSAHVHWQSTNNSSNYSPRPSHLVTNDDDDTDQPTDAYLLAKNHFDQHQLERCVWVLEHEACNDIKSTFLRLYARFLMSERKLDEHGILIPKPNGKMPATSPNLIPILKELLDPSDPFLLFLKGAILRKLERPIEAMDSLILSVQQFPYNWAAWQELSMTLEPCEVDQIQDLLPDSFMVSFFCEFTDRHSAQQGDETIQRIDHLLTYFTKSAYLLTCRAQTHVHRLDYVEAEQDFQEAWSIDPYRVDGLSDYSNALYLLNRTAELAQLAHKFASFGRDRPEVCCLVGNYYNQRGDHHRAVEAFRHALRLDPGCVPAWILLGHEYIELKNSHAAAEMYRRALRIHPREYRALYGLGQVYELNGAYTYAVHYFQKCASIRPYDGRMWSSMGICYFQLSRSQDAISCFKRYLTCRLNQSDTIIGLTKLIEVYEKEKQYQIAATYHKTLVQLIDGCLIDTESNVISRYTRSYIIAARWEMGEIGNHHPSSFTTTEEEGGEKEKRGNIGNLALANDYLQKVIAAGTEMTDTAEILLKRLAFLRV